MACVFMLSSGGANAEIPRLDTQEDAASYFDLPDRRLVISAGWVRAERYWERVRSAARERGVPEGHFFALALIESGFYPYAKSPSGAEGMWQFMPETASDLGLHGRSARTSIEPSARASATYLSQLYRRFGSWELALAAYNAGPGRVSRVIQSAGSSDWVVVRKHLRPETHSYVPKVLYLSRTYYPRFLKGEPPPEPSILWEIRSGDTWWGLSKRFGIEQDILHMLNRGPLHPGAPIAFPGWQHAVTSGETLDSIADRYGISTDLLLSANDNPELLTAGTMLLIPRPDALD